MVRKWCSSLAARATYPFLEIMTEMGRRILLCGVRIRGHGLCCGAAMEWSSSSSLAARETYL
jgi:hypothetical protein